MVEEPRPPEQPGDPNAGRPEERDSAPLWVWRLVMGTLGLTAAWRYLFGRRPEGHQDEEPPPTVATEVPRHDVEEVRYPDGRIEHPRVRYERTDASFAWIFGLLLAAMGLAALIHYLVLVFFYDFRNYQARIKESPYPLAAEPSEALPPEPRLEPLDRVERIEKSNVYVRQAAKEETLNKYGRTEEPGFVHIPIEVAMKLVVGRLKTGSQVDAPALGAGVLGMGAGPTGPGLFTGLAALTADQAGRERPEDREHENGLVDAGESNSGRMYWEELQKKTGRKGTRWYEH